MPTQPLKVVRIIARLNIGGPARHVGLLEANLPARGYQSLLVYGQTAADEAEMATDLAARGLPSVQVPQLGRRLSVIKDTVAFVRVTAILFRVQPDIVHSHTAKAGTVGRLAAWVYNLFGLRRRRCVVVHTFHGHVFQGYFSPRMNRVVQLVERMLACITDRVVTISELQRREIVEQFRIVPAARAIVVPLGLELTRLAEMTGGNDALRRRAGFERDDVVCGYVGRLAPIKNVELLLGAFAKALRAAPRARLLIVGDGECRAQLEAAVPQELRGKVHFAGWQLDLPEVYSSMDIVALTSRNEGTPVALIEAMAAGRAVVSTAVGGVPDVIENGRTGLLVPTGDVDAFAAALELLLTDESERTRLSAAARINVVERFGVARLVDDIDRAYREVLARVRN